MKTEELQRSSVSQIPDEVSRSLQEATPVWCTIVDRHGRPATLSSAGYVLRGNGSYRLRLVSPFNDEEVQEVRIVSPPSFTKTEPEVRQIDEQGRAVRSISFKVPIQFSHIWRLGFGVLHDDLEIVHIFKPGSQRESQPYMVPVVVRPVLISLLAAMLLGLLGCFLPKLATEFFFGDKSAEYIVDILQTPDKWLWMLAVTLGAFVFVNALNLMLLYGRSRELRHGFRERYPVVAMSGKVDVPA